MGRQKATDRHGNGTYATQVAGAKKVGHLTHLGQIADSAKQASAEDFPNI